MTPPAQGDDGLIVKARDRDGFELAQQDNSCFALINNPDRLAAAAAA